MPEIPTLTAGLSHLSGNQVRTRMQYPGSSHSSLHDGTGPQGRTSRRSAGYWSIDRIRDSGRRPGCPGRYGGCRPVASGTVQQPAARITKAKTTRITPAVVFMLIFLLRYPEVVVVMIPGGYPYSCRRWIPQIRRATSFS